MDEESAYITIELRKLEKYVRVLPTLRHVRELERAARESALDMQDSLSEARRLANDSALSDKPDVKTASFARSQEQLENFREALLRASQYDLVDAADVAQLSAMAEQVNDLIRKRIADL
jgi:hypothetical protein